MTQSYSERRWLLTISILLAVIVFFVNFGSKGPMIQADEGSYLSNAAAIAGYQNDMASNYHAGYSLLISPAFLMGDSPNKIWIFVKVINTLLFLSIVLLLWMISKRWTPNLSPKKRSMAVVLVSAYPMWVIMAGYSFSQIAFVPVFLLMVLFFLEAVSGKKYAWPVLGLVSGYLYWIHPTAVAALIAVCISLIYVAWKLRCYKRFFIFFSVLLCVVVAYRIGMVPWLLDRMTISGQPANSHYPSASKMLSVLLSWDGIKKTLSLLGGHVFYLSIGSLGFIVSGCYALTGKGINFSSDKVAAPEELLWKASGLFLLLTLIFSVLLSAVFMSEAVRLDHWMYGRYVEGFIAPILLAGVLTDSWRKILWAIPVAAIGACLLNLSLDSYTHTAPFNVSTFWQEFFIRDKGLFMWLWAGVFPIALVGLLHQRISYFIAIVFFCFCSYLQIVYHNQNSKAAVNRWEAAEKVRDQFHVGTCVGFDEAGLNSYKAHVFWSDFGFVLFNYALQRMSFDKWIATCDGPFFSYVKDFNERNVIIYPLSMSLQDGPPTLWVKGQAPISELYPMSVADRSVSLQAALGTGWHKLEKKYVWSDKEAQLKLPVPKKCQTGRCSVKIYFSAFGVSNKRPVDVIVLGSEGNAESIEPIHITTSLPQEVIVPLDSGKSAQLICFQIPAAISPKELQGSADSRVLGIALQRIELIETRSQLPEPEQYPISVVDRSELLQSALD